MKLKTLRKKIGRLEARLQEDAKKLAKLKRKLNATAAAGGRTKKKSAARAGKSRRTQKKKGRSEAKAQVKQAATRQGAAQKVKRKLNLSPERRAELAAAMKARWAAKRAAVNASPQDSSTNRDFTLGPNPQGA
jgi:hypothetical protein